MKTALWIAHKDLVVLSRDKLALLWVVVFPLAFALFFGTVLEGAIERAARCTGCAPRPRRKPLCWRARRSHAGSLACVAVLLVLVAALFFDARIEHPLVLAVSVAAAAGGFVGITVLLGVTGKSAQSVAGAGRAVLLACAMFGGAMVPTSLMPEWLRDVGEASPVRWGLSALETALFGSGTIESIAADSAKLLALGVMGIACAAFVLRRTARA